MTTGKPLKELSKTSLIKINTFYMCLTLKNKIHQRFSCGVNSLSFKSLQYGLSEIWIAIHEIW